MTSSRPSPKELNGKLSSARRLLSESKWAPAAPIKLTPQFHELDLFTEEEQTEALIKALDEITPDNYKGSRPPQKAYEPTVRDKEMFAFEWDSNHLKCRMYLKFCLVQELLYVVSMHKSVSQGGDE